MRRLLVSGVLVLGLAVPAWAKPPHGRGQPAQAKGPVVQAAEEVTDEAVDAVMDELVGEDTTSVGSSGLPPGLAKQGKVPPGLAKQGKTPPGWDKGNKQGWETTSQPEKRDGLIRRVIRGIFRGGPRQAE